jgi:hypothetical protein
MHGSESGTVVFEPLSATLVLDQTDFDELVEVVTHSREPAGWHQRWHAAGLISNDRLDPTVEAMATVSADAVRQFVVERVIAGAADELLAAWDPTGRVVMIRRVTEHRITVQMTSFELLPTLLGQHLRLLRSTEPTPKGRHPVDSTTDAINAMLDPDTQAPPTDSPNTSNELTETIGILQLGWRLSAGWTGKDPDTSLIGISTTQGHWLAGQQSGTARIVPISAATAIDQLGNAVSGNSHKPIT